MSMYTTAQLLAANEQKFKFDPLFLRLFFRESYPFTTEKVYLSQIPGLVNMALYVSPIVSGEVIRSRGGSTSEFTPGYVKPKHEVNPQMTLRRLPDEDPQNLADPAYRRRRIIMQNMRDEELAIAQVEEMQAVSAVLKGKYTMTGEAFDPVPDIWLPLNDSLEAITGYAPGYKTITIGSDEITMPVNGICQFSRASSATYIDKSGHITVAGNNVPRFEKYGLLIENQRTNMFVNSFNPDAWNKSGGISVTSSTDEFEFKYGRFTVGSDIAGTTTGRNICTVAGNKGIDVTGDDQYSKGPYVTASFRVRSDLNVRARIRFERYNSEGYTFLCDAYLSLQTHELQITGGNAQLLTANFEIDPGSGWIYFQATLKCLPEWGMVGTQLQIAADRAVGSFATGDWIEVTTPQFEYGACATSFIITTTEPATRASDLCKFPLMKNMYTMPFTFMVEVHKNWFISHNAAPRVIDSENHQSGGPFIMGFGSSGTISQDGYSYCDIGGANRRVYESCGVRDLVMGFRVKADGMTCSFANKHISTETKTVWKYIREAAVIRIGGQTTTGLRHLNGHIKNLRFWNRALSDTQLKEYV